MTTASGPVTSSVQPADTMATEPHHSPLLRVRELTVDLPGPAPA